LRQIGYEGSEMADSGSQKRRKKSGTSTKARRSGEKGGWLRDRYKSRSERRYASTTSAATWLTVLGLSIAGVLAGAGVYGQWLFGATPHKYAPYLLVGGVVMAVAVVLLGRWSAPTVRVGDAGVALEKEGGGELERIAWNEITEIVLTGDSLTLQAAGRLVTLGAGAQPQAFSRALAEAKRRRPDKMQDVHVPEGLTVPLDDAVGQVVALDPPQVAGKRCRASDQLIAFERDARLCVRCGEVYHKDGAPAACVTCSAS
jgi:hypothetical protein